MLISLKYIWIVMLKELKTTFLSPLIYVIAGLFIILSGWMFFTLLVSLDTKDTYGMTTSVLVPLFGNINFIFMFIVPLLTMHIFSDEFKNNTSSLLFLSKLKNHQIILGKYFSTILSSVFIISLTLIFPLVLSVAGYSDWGVVATSYLGLFLAITTYCLIGIFASTLTEHQMLSGVLCFFILFAFFLLALSAGVASNPMVAQLLGYLGMAFHYAPFSRGAIRSYDLVYFICIIILFFYLSLRSLESKRW